MAFKGSIKEFSLVDILQLLAQTGKSGILHVHSQERHIKIFVKEGYLVDVKSDSDDFTTKIGKYLTIRNVLTKHQLDDLLAKQKKLPVRFGKLIVQEGILSQDELKSILTEMLKENFTKAMEIENGQYEFVKSVVEYNEDEIEPLNINNILLDILKDIDEIRLYKKKIASFLVKYNKVNNNKKVNISKNINNDKPVIVDKNNIHLNDESFLVYSQIDGNNTVTDIIDRTALSEHFVLKVIFLLSKEGVIDSEKISKDSFSEMGRKFLHNTGLALLFIIVMAVITLNVSNLLDLKISTGIAEEKSEINKIYIEQINEIVNLTDKREISTLNLNHKNYLRYFTVEKQ